MGKNKSLNQKPVSGLSQQIYINNNPITLKFMKLKNFNRLLFLAFALLLFISQSCVKEGPIGLTGANGTNGANGKDANSSCLSCHATAVMDVMQSQYKLSKHFTGTTVARNGKYCARCHTSDGFKEITGNGQFVVSNDIPNATRIDCSTCHKHSSFDFSGDTALYILRTTSPVALNYYNNAKTQDFGKIQNLCSTCHQIRGLTTPTVYKNAADSIAKKADATFKQLPFFPLDNTKDVNTAVNYQVGQSFSVHDGNQSNLFTGINGYEYPGKTYTRTWKHSDWTCISCHMNEYNATTKTGGHTLTVNEQKCLDCHKTDKIALVQAAISGKIVELRDLLVTKKIFGRVYSKTSTVPGTISYSAMPTHDYYGVLLPSSPTPGTTKYGLSLVNYNTVSPTTGLVVYASTVALAIDQSKPATSSTASVIGSADRLGRAWKYGELGAAYNYGYINSELSIGVHNPVYALQILQNSIDYLKSY